MSIGSKVSKWWNGLWGKASRTLAADTPLREFVYLDEVSLRSLLSSQTGEVTDSVSEQSADSWTSDSGGKAALDAQVLKAEFTSRFQTTNSSSLQTSRKATVQSWFREFHSLPDLRVIEVSESVSKLNSVQELTKVDDKSIISAATSLTRGSLVEFRVILAADPVFRLGTMVSEFTGMADDFPEMFAADNGLATLKEMQPTNKVLQRMLAGLIPVRAEAVDYVVVRIDDVDYVVHRAAISGLELTERPLEIVGVTEHLAYWKDIRRVLFSDAEFTMLCRISRTGLHDSWTPVKLADIFRSLAPTLVDQINAAGRTPLAAAPAPKSIAPQEQRLIDALKVYIAASLAETGAMLTPDQANDLQETLWSVRDRAGAVTDQRSAFAVVAQRLREATNLTIPSARDLELREQARTQSGLSLFPSMSARTSETNLESQPVSEGPAARILDVEVVAIYW